MKAGLYLRVSTGNQDVENQRIALKQLAQARGWETVEYVDDGFSGALGEDRRPGLKTMMEDAMRGKIQIVAVWDFSRFARSLRHLIDGVEKFRSWNVSFVSVRENCDTSTANGRLLLNLFGSIGEFERELVRERTMLGLAKARAKGHFPGPRRNAVDVDELRRLRSEGMSLRKLETHFGVSDSTLLRLIGKGEIQTS